MLLERQMDQNKDMDRVLDKLDKIDDRLGIMDVTLVRNTASLEEHIRRTNLLEQAQKELKDSVKPLIKVHTVVYGICKIIAGAAVLGGLIKLFL